MSDPINDAARALSLAPWEDLTITEQVRWLNAAGRLAEAGLLAKYPHLDIEGDWLIEVVNYHTCGAGPGSGAGHEPGCGTIPVGRLATPEHDAAVAAKALRDAADALKSDAMEWHAEDMRDHSGEPSDCECSEEGLCHEYARFTALHGRAPIWLRDRADHIEAGGHDA